MTAYLVIALVSAFAASLTLYSGFGLGTLLLPAFALFFPVEVAVAATAIVHGANNVFKVSLVGKYADRTMVLKFGVPAILAAMVGAALLGWFTTFQPLAVYEVAGRTAVVTPIKLTMGMLMFFFAFFELLPRFKNLRFGPEQLVVGGVLSGFFGGLSGHQGALRSAFLVKSGLDTQAFVGTSSVIGLMVDGIRILVYLLALMLAGVAFEVGRESWPLVLTGCFAAFAGVLLGKRFLHKVTIGAVQSLTGILLLLVATGLTLGVI